MSAVALENSPAVVHYPAQVRRAFARPLDQPAKPSMKRL
jgi:hypothetical protein